MKLKIAAYGIARDILGGNEIEYETSESITPDALLDSLRQDYPDFAKLNSLLIAINSEYAKPDQAISADDEVVLIPPVSGG